MKILIAEDDAVPRTVMERTLSRAGHEVVVTTDGESAYRVLTAQDAPKLAILDWMMPIMDGPEVCRRVRSLARSVPTYMILLTAKTDKNDVVRGLESGADDYVTKPFDLQELRSRIRVGQRMIDLQQRLADRVDELEDALSQVKQLRGLLPICSYCKKIRDGENYWQQVEKYIATHAGVDFSHGICPGCWESIIVPELHKHGKCLAHAGGLVEAVPT